MKRVFLRSNLCNNLGDDLMIWVITHRYPQVKFYVFAKKGNDLGLKNIPNLYVIHPDFFIRGINKIGRLLFHDSLYTSRFVRNSDATILIGGSMFMESSDSDSIFDSYQELTKHSKHCIVLGTDFGPYTTENFKSRYMQFFQKMDQVCFRDQYSYRLFSVLVNATVVKDLVFNYPAKFLEHENRISIIPIDLSSHQDIAQKYESWLNKLIEMGINANYEVELISFCESQGDGQVIERISKGINSPLLKINHYLGNIESVVEDLYRSTYIITSRLHGVVLGMLGECRIVPVIDNPKMTHLLDDLEFDGLRIDLNHFEEVMLYDLLHKSKVIPMQEIDESQFTYLDSILK